MAVAVAVLLAIAASAGQVLLKVGAAKHVTRDGSLTVLGGLGQLLTEPSILAGLGIYGFCAIAWLWVLSKLQVSEAYPILSLSFIFVPLIANLAIGERLTMSHWIGSVLICVGVLVLLSGTSFSMR